MRLNNEHADLAEAPGTRLLPWTGTGGKPSCVVGDGTGHVSRMADDIESIQLDMADELLGHAADLLNGNETATGQQVRFLADRLTESLRQIVRVAESRGSWLDAILPDRSEPRTGGGEAVEHLP